MNDRTKMALMTKAQFHLTDTTHKGCFTNFDINKAVAVNGDANAVSPYPAVIVMEKATLDNPHDEGVMHKIKTDEVVNPFTPNSATITIIERTTTHTTKGCRVSGSRLSTIPLMSIRVSDLAKKLQAVKSRNSPPKVPKSLL